MEEKEIIKSERGITGTDIVIAVTALILFAGAVGTILYQSYQNNIQVRTHAEATAYLTQILEYVDEVEYGEVNEQFSQVINDNLSIPDQYTIKITIEPLKEKADIIKKVTIQLSYDSIQGKDSMTMSKIKVKEL